MKFRNIYGTKKISAMQPTDELGTVLHGRSLNADVAHCLRYLRVPLST